MGQAFALTSKVHDPSIREPVQCVAADKNGDVVIGASSAFQVVERLIERMAAFDAPVLIEGETGTGKELAARAIHYRGPRRDRPFVPVNCGALPDSLIESELFGHRRGAFTDAREDQVGMIAVAHSGTLFLDEVDALTPKGQVTLLRFLQDRQYRPLGARREEQADVRIIAASNRSLESLVADGSFRLDLLYRLKLMWLQLPPLRQRHGDIQLLAEHFLRIGCARFGCPQRCLAAPTAAWFEAYAWPGNVRELEHVVYQALLIAEGATIDLEPPRCLTPTEPSATCDSFREAKESAIATFEQTYLTQLLDRAQGNVSVAARLARTERRHFGRLLKKYGLGRSLT